MLATNFAKLIVLLFFLALFSAFSVSGQAVPTGKNPIIVIPGLSGSELRNSKTNELVWFKAQRSKDDDIRLPISLNLSENRDNLVSGDIIRSFQLVRFLPEIEIYERLIDALQTRGGYREASWTVTRKEDYHDTFYIFAYDWRRDNVENARLLFQKITALKRKLGKPGLKFDVVAHSMGGLIARYAAMYGNAELGTGLKRPTWAGARHFEKIFLIGTPNEGSILSLQAVLDGVPFLGGGINLPFVQNINRYDIFSMQSIFQLLPATGTLQAFDENLKPIKIDLYDAKTWELYGWAIWQDAEFTKRLSEKEQAAARGYFSAVLERAKRFQSALAANVNPITPVSMYLLGADCKETPSAVVVLKDAKKDRWKTLFRPVAFERADGTRVSVEEQKPLLTAMGDGVVTQRSLRAQTNGRKAALPVTEELYQCETHNRLLTNVEIQSRLFALLLKRSVKAAK